MVDENEFIVSGKLSGEVFVYGREVDDFHIVDYEAIAMLNVSATQEMFKRFQVQSSKVETLEEENEKMKAELQTIKEHLGLETKAQR